jgi:hypothetical protein
MDYLMIFCTVTGSEADVPTFETKHIIPHPHPPENGAPYFDFETVLETPVGAPWISAIDYTAVLREPGKLKFHYLTPCFHRHIFAKLAGTYPRLAFAFIRYDERYEGACTGEGEFGGKNDFHEVDPRPELERRMRDFTNKKALLAAHGLSARAPRGRC